MKEEELKPIPRDKNSVKKKLLWTITPEQIGQPREKKEFLQIFNLPKSESWEIENLTGLIIRKEIE